MNVLFICQIEHSHSHLNGHIGLLITLMTVNGEEILSA